MDRKRCLGVFRRLGFSLAGLALALTCGAADPVVSNVTVAQCPGTKLVDIGYELTADGEAEILVSVSQDGGTTWTVPGTSLTGAVEPFPANGYGLHDMPGNVWEWCWDVDPEESDSLVNHGGGWYGDPDTCRIASRGGFEPDDRWFDFGFRVCTTTPARQGRRPCAIS